MTSDPSDVRNCAIPPDHLRSAISFSCTSNILDLILYAVYKYRIALSTLGTLHYLCICMFAQLHALRAQANKHLFSLEFLRGALLVTLRKASRSKYKNETELDSFKIEEKFCQFKFFFNLYGKHKEKLIATVCVCFPGPHQCFI